MFRPPNPAAGVGRRCAAQLVQIPSVLPFRAPVGHVCRTVVVAISASEVHLVWGSGEFVGRE